MRGPPAVAGDEAPPARSSGALKVLVIVLALMVFALARQVGVPAIVVYLNKVDQVDDPELLDLVAAMRVETEAVAETQPAMEEDLGAAIGLDSLGRLELLAEVEDRFDLFFLHVKQTDKAGEDGDLVLLDELQHVRRGELGNEGDGGPSFKRNQGEGAESGGKGYRGGSAQDVTGLHLVDVFVYDF